MQPTSLYASIVSLLNNINYKLTLSKNICELCPKSEEYISIWLISTGSLSPVYAK